MFAKLGVLGQGQRLLESGPPGGSNRGRSLGTSAIGHPFVSQSHSLFPASILLFLSNHSLQAAMMMFTEWVGWESERVNPSSGSTSLCNEKVIDFLHLYEGLHNWITNQPFHTS